MSKRNEEPNRYRVARSDASVGSIEKRIEKDYGLPKGSIKITNPTGRDTRSDSRVGTLRNRWEKS